MDINISTMGLRATFRVHNPFVIQDYDSADELSDTEDPDLLAELAQFGKMLFLRPVLQLAIAGQNYHVFIHN